MEMLFRSQLISHHPTRWARNCGGSNFKPSKKLSHHPTRWARNRIREQTFNTIPLVTIPHGGLGTELGNRPLTPSPSSPSHTVGLEHWERIGFRDWVSRSPSHAVGFEHVFEDGGLALVLREGSPSHAVGLEQRRPSKRVDANSHRHPTRWA